MSGTEPGNPQWEAAEQWFAKAVDDRQVAALAIAASPALLDPAAYHCQLAIEKLMKGLLLTCAAAVPRTHDLEHLASLLAPRYPALGAQLSLLAKLSPWGTITRYPTPERGIGPSAAEIVQAIEQIDALIEGIQSLRHQPRQSQDH